MVLRVWRADASARGTLPCRRHVETVARAALSRFDERTTQYEVVTEVPGP